MENRYYVCSMATEYGVELLRGSTECLGVYGVWSVMVLVNQ